MKAIIQTALLAVILLLITGCATMEASKAPGVDLTRLKTFYVQKLPADQREIETIISDQLNAMGYRSTYGISDKPPAEVDAIVTYQDRWMWDITMYMLQLNIQLRDPKTGMILASGQSLRPSLQRKSPQEMAAEVLNEIFKKN